MTAPANLIAPMLRSVLPKLELTQAWNTAPGGGIPASSGSTFSIGSGSADRRVILVLQNGNGTLSHFASPPTIDGVPMTQLMIWPGSGDKRCPCGIWIADKPGAATTAAFAWALTGGDNDGQAAFVYSLKGARSATPVWSAYAFDSGATITDSVAEKTTLLYAFAATGISGGSVGSLSGKIPPLVSDGSLAWWEGVSIGAHGATHTPLGNITPGISCPYDCGIFGLGWR